MQTELRSKSIALIVSLSLFFGGIGGGYLISEPRSDTPSLLTLKTVSEDNPSTTYNVVPLNTLSLNSPLTIPEIVAQTADTVVEITTEQVVTNARMGQYVTEGAGSGVIITSDGYIITNNHVIAGSEKIKVTLRNGQEYEATLVGRDAENDIAVLKIETTALQYAVLGDSDALVVGELAVVIGNPLGELGGTVTEGIISALNRAIDIDGVSMNLLQTSAAISPGNSGGGLFNQFGELVGVVNAKSSGSDVEGLGFAIPINTAKEIGEQLITYGYIPGRPDLGFSVIAVDDANTARMYRLSQTGVYVYEVTNAASLVVGDRIVSINGDLINNGEAFNAAMDAYQAGDTLKIIVSRNGNTLEINHILGQLKY